VSDERALRTSLERLQGEVKRLEAWTPDSVVLELNNATALRLTEVQAELERAHEQLAEAEADLAETKAATRETAIRVFAKQQSSVSPDHQSAVNLGGALGVTGGVLAAILGSFVAGFIGTTTVAGIMLAVSAGLAGWLGWKRL
jgi:VIT1/CCC1 family predicted Fe2+/Mn2+ transporter